MSERRPEGVEGYTLDTGLFPFDAWTFTEPTVATPTLAIKPAWTLSVSGPAIMTYVMPTGAILPYGGRVTPSGWLSCGGQAVSRTTYSRLFTAVSTSWGVGDGSSTFNLPDLRGVGIRGAGTNGARSTATNVPYNGLSVGSPLNDQVQGHYHRETADTGSGGTGNRLIGAAGNTTNLATDKYTEGPSTDAVNGTPRTGAETRMATSSVLFIIKT